MKRIMLYLPLFLLCYNHDIHAEAFNGKELEISTDDVSGFSVSKAEIVYPDISNFYPVPGTAYTIQNDCSPKYTHIQVKSMERI